MKAQSDCRAQPSHQSPESFRAAAGDGVPVISRRLAIAAIALTTVLALAASGSAQTPAGYPPATPGAAGEPSSPGGRPSAVREPGRLGSTSIVVVPDSSGDDSSSPAAPESAPSAHTSTNHHRPHHYAAAASATDYSAIEPAQGHLKLTKDSFAYRRPSESSTRVEPVHAGKFVNVTGTSRYFVQVKLRNSETAYVPISAVELVTPADKVFQLTNDTAVFSAPNHASKQLAAVHKGHSVHVIGVALRYMKIRMKDGTEGFIPTGALE